MAEETIVMPAEIELSPVNLLALALRNNAAIDVIERLAALQEKAMAREAEICFNEGMNRVQEQIKRIAPDLENPQTRSQYASYAAIDRKIRPIYSKEGFSLSFDTADCPLADHVRAVCYVSLRGHTRRYQVDMPADGKGAKGGDVMTKTHATGAAMSYGMRYLVKYIFNIAVGEEDTDGNMDNGRLQEHFDNIARAQTMDELKQIFKIAYTEAEAAKAKAAMIALMRAKDEAKKRLAMQGSAQKPQPAVETKQEPVEAPTGKISQGKIKRLFAIMRESNVTEADLRQYVHESYGYESTKELNDAQYEQVINWLRSVAA
jgi:hypothetical protein